MPLMEPAPIPALSDLGALHFIGLGGAGMSGLASLYLDVGATVSGCDQVDSAGLRALGARGVITAVGHDPAHLDGVDTVVVSSAIRADNAELVEAARRRCRVLHRSLALAALMDDQTVVAVAGSHGKTTTSAMTVASLRVAGADPSFVIGGNFTDSGQSAHRGGDRLFVVEADESDGSFRQYPTTVAVITGIEADHLDNWVSEAAYRAGFSQFASAAGVNCLVANGDDPAAAELARQMAASGRMVRTYGQSAGCDLVVSAVDLSGPTATARFDCDGWGQPIRLSLPGRHNLLNAAAAWLVGNQLGCDRSGLVEGLERFTGTARRFQTVGQAGGVTVIDDYAHHPTEVAATIAAAREVAGAGRVIVAFQPHLFSRTRDFADAFGQALALADRSVVLDVYPAREDPIPGVSGQTVADAALRAGANVDYVPRLADLATAVGALTQPGDLVLTMGAGSITTAGPAILARLAL